MEIRTFEIEPFTKEPYRLLDEEGKPLFDFEPEDFGLSKEFLLRLYKDILLTREIDRMGWILVRQGKAYFYISIGGQETSHVASLYALEKDDLVMPFYRTVPSLHVRGAKVEEIFAQIMGRASDPLKGRQMPGHFGKKDLNIFVLGSPVGLGHPVAMGVAMGIKYKKENKVIISYGGEGSTSEGHFHSAMNFASVFGLPLIIFIVNNQYAISVPRVKQTASETIAIKAKAYGAEGYYIDGNDALITYLVTKKCVNEARLNKRPFLIEAETYRFDPHSSADDDKKYRSREELEMWKRKDGLLRLKKYLEYLGIWNEEKDEFLKREIEEKLNKIVEEVEKIPFPEPRDMFYEVYVKTPWYLEEEYLELKKEMEE
ncbi:MAG: thiamine pyrophosphate-dependent dehydrogenase E1 component subunit alpha [candidate division WOR-3 bacterium]